MFLATNLNATIVKELISTQGDYDGLVTGVLYHKVSVNKNLILGCDFLLQSLWSWESSKFWTYQNASIL